MNKTTLTIIICVCLLKSIGSYGQLKTTQSFSSTSTNHLCSTSYILDSLGYFFYEAGCEGRSRIAMGYYTIKNDTVSFNFCRIDTLPPFISIIETPATNDTSTKITILTRFGTPFKRQVDVIKNQDSLVKRVQPDESGTVSINPQKCDSIEIRYLRRFYHIPIRLKVNHKNMKITISLPYVFTFYQFSRLVDVGNSSMRLKKDGLYEFFSDEVSYSIDQ